MKRLSLVSLVLFASTAVAQEASSPLRFVPTQAELVIQVDRPRDLLHAVEKNPLFQEAQKLPGIREYYDTSNFQQLYQVIAYFEKQLGSNRDEIISDVTAGGVALAAKLTPPGGAVVIIQSKDEKKLRRFLDVAFDLLQKELDRQESKDKIVRSKFEGHDVGKFGPAISFAIADGAFLVASEDKVLKMALEARAKKKSVLQVAGFADAQAKTPAKRLAWLWLNLEEVRKNPQFKNGLDASAGDPFQMILFGGLTDLLRRSPNLSAAVVPDDKNAYRVSLRMPVGRDGMAPIKHMILPADGAGTDAPLQVPRVISSSSFILDLGELWEKRVAILGEKNAKGLDEGEKNIAKFLGGIKLGKLLKGMGANQRLVFAQQKEQPYKIKPATPFPAFALVVDMRDPTFAKDMNSIFRAGALLATFQVGLALKEQTYKDCEMVSYYFSETKKVEGDPQNTRFNFNPSYVKVGNYFVMSATAELARDLIDALQAEQKQEPRPASMRTQLFASGLADTVRMNEEAALTQLILSQALPPKTARAELATILDFVNRLGTLSVESNYGASDFRYDILWQPKR
jgi:hypothetical protein